MSRAAQQAAWRAAQCLPLLGALALLRELPVLVQTPLAGVVVLPWRLDALTLVVVLSLAAGIAVVPLSPRRTLLALALAAVLLPALLLEHLLALPAALLSAAVALRSRRWLLAGLLLGGALAWPYVTAGAGWNDAAVVPALGTPIAAGLLAAAALVLAPRLRGQADPLELALRAIWLLPLLRAIGLQPWRAEVGLLGLAAGCCFALWSTVAALRDPQRQTTLAATGSLAAALGATCLLTPVGVAAALYGLLAYPLGLGLLLRVPRLAAPLPLTAAFVSAWLVMGAVAAAGVWLFAAALLLAALGSGAALLVGPHLRSVPSQATGEGSGVRAGAEGAILLGASWLLGICAPPVLERLILPAVDLLQGGLTPFGLLAVWPWIGVAALDAGQRRVTTLPTIALLLYGLVCAAGVWLAARVLVLGIRDERPAAPNSSQFSVLSAQFRSRVWWLDPRRDG